MSKLLINEPPLQVLPSLAVAIGLDEAIALQQLHYWLNNPKSEGRVDESGVKWVYNTYAEWKEKDFPFWSEDKIQRVFLDLEKIGLVISAQLDAKKRDMRKFYRIDYGALCTMDDSFLRPSNAAKSPHVKYELTETTTESIISSANRTVDGILRATLSPKSIQDAIRDYFRLTPRWEGKYEREWMQWAMEEKVTPEQIRGASELWRSDKRFNWSIPTLKGIHEHWLELSTTEINFTQTLPKDGSGFYA